jgi:Fur family ferric uptake transcriptional regulator
VDRVTIYRVLNRFCEDGRIHRIVSDEGKTYFALCLNCDEKKHRHDHFHFRCLNCQQVHCLKEKVNVKLPKGYRLEQVNCLLTGYCRDCA